MQTKGAESTAAPSSVTSEPPRKDFSAKITAVALVIIALFLSGSAFLLMGVGTTPSTMYIGFGVFPYFIGTQLLLLSGGLFLFGLFFACLGYKRQVLKIFQPKVA